MLFIFTFLLTYGSYLNRVHAEEVPNTPLLTVSTNTGYQNDAVYITVDIQGIIDLSALSFEIYYDHTNLHLYSSSPSDWLNDATTSLNDDEPGVFLFSLASSTPLTGSGLLVNLWFNIDSLAPLGDQTLTLIVGEAYDVTLTPLSIQGNHGTIHVIERSTSYESIYIYEAYDTREQSFGDIVQIDYSSSQLKNLSSGSFTFYYDAQKLEYMSYEMGGLFDLPNVIYTMNDTTPGYLKLSFASSQGISYSYPIIKVRFKVIVDENNTTHVMMKASDLYDHNLIPLICSDVISPISLKQIPPSTNFPDMTISGYEGSNQTPFDVSVSLEGQSGLAAGDFLITYDITKIRATNVIIHDDVTLIGGYLMFHESFDQGTIRFSYINENGAILPGHLLTITFEPVEHGTSTTGSLNISGTGVVGTDLNSLSLDFVSSTYKLGTQYTIIFADGDDVIETQTLFEGETIIAPVPPLKVGYRFVGWDQTFSTATQNINIQAVYEIDHSMQFLSLTTIYDGQPHSLALSNLIEGATVTYSDDLSYIYPGTYTVSATISKPDYEDLILSATLTIQKASITITADNKLTPYGTPLAELTYRIQGSLYDTLEITLVKAPGLDAGQYPITIQVTHPYYEIVLISGTYTIIGQEIDISGITFTSKTVTYDGSVHEIFIQGELPYGILSVEYTNHQGEDVGSYYAIAHFVVEQGFNPIDNLLAELTITPAIIDGITFTGINVTYDGLPHTIDVSSIITRYGDQLNVNYTPSNTFIHAGDYTITATLTHPNYETLILNAQIIINKADLMINQESVFVNPQDTSILIVYDDEDAPIYYSIDGIHYTLGREITGLDDFTAYTVSIYIGESTNYLPSNILSYDVSTYRSYDELVEIFMVHENKISYSTYQALIDLHEDIPHANPIYQEDLTLRLNKLINEYNSYIEEINTEYEGVRQYLTDLLPILALSSFGLIAFVVLRKGREQ